MCFRVKAGKTQILLVTSRETKRWVIPKGWLIPGKTAADSAVIEAFEEAGVQGRLFSKSVGGYTYSKSVHRAKSLTCLVRVYPLEVKTLLAKFPERHQRKRKWFAAKRAAAMVKAPGLAKLILRFDPQGLND
ncbi:NUDIX hydrolase [Pseudoruegeria sp. SK021]|uniref:NUDIX hydrolase n=1 Tax=Pseudoruegeria sp. SK021 TaxID=1933035 RepID=UPI000A329BD8|nr:NUDIX hydrolase [Pseudoruegeria sp. SK021]